MATKKAAGAAQRTTKVTKEKDIVIIFEYFRYTIGTTLDAAKATNILRNSITYYVRDLERAGLLKAIYKKQDRTTGRTAKHYSSDPSNWRPQHDRQLSLFPSEPTQVGRIMESLSDNPDCLLYDIKRRKGGRQ